MSLVIYADLLWMINTVLNYTALHITGALCGIPAKRLRLWAVAMTGGAIGLLFVNSLSPSAKLTQILLALLLCRAAFGKQVAAVRLGFLFLFCNAAMLGVLRLFWCGAQQGKAEYVPTGMLLLLALLMELVCETLLRLEFAPLCKKQCDTLRLTISLGGRTISIRALLDTGNELREPVSQKKVLLLAQKSACTLLGIKEHTFRYDLKSLCEAVPEFQRRCGMIACHTVCGSDLLIFFRPDNIKTESGESVAAVIAIMRMPWQARRYEGIIGT